MPDIEWTFRSAIQLAVVAFAAWILLRTLWEVFDALESRTWPTTSGVIVASKVTEEAGSEGDRMFRAKVAYRFTVARQEILSDRTCFGATGRRKVRARRRGDGFLQSRKPA
ncbi:MAG TPA: DUF3592 domain-containing protein [Thermoanaerobaculia bacterium]|jgi:hypothetical protein|nr:DUF3592 domain-containing protein [Thermoanaerobaculia bacterium]